MARTDDVINVAGHRLSTGRDGGGAGGPSGRGGVRGDRHGRRAEGAAAARLPLPEQGLRPRSARRSSPNACSWCATGSGRSRRSGRAVVVDRLPKTRSGKILRGVMSRMADGQAWKMPATIDDPADSRTRSARVSTRIGRAFQRPGFAADATVTARSLTILRFANGPRQLRLQFCSRIRERTPYARNACMPNTTWHGSCYHKPG